MSKKKTEFRFNISILIVVGILLVFAAAGALHWYGNAKSWQAVSAIMAQIGRAHV